MDDYEGDEEELSDRDYDEEEDDDEEYDDDDDDEEEEPSGPEVGALFKESGNAEYKKGNYREAIALYTKAVVADPATPAYLTNRAACHMMLLDYAKAIDDAKAAVALDKNNLKGYLRWAKALLSQGCAEEAIKVYQQALLRDPTNATGLNEKKSAELLLDKMERAEAYLEAGKYRMACSVTATAMETAPGSNRLRALNARGLMGMGQVDEAYAILTALMRKDPGNLDLVFQRGRALYLQGNAPQAQAHFSQILRSDPDNKAARVELKKVKALDKAKQAGNAAFKAGKWGDAIASYTECLAVDPSIKNYNAKVICNRAAALTNLGKYEDALRDCDQAIRWDKQYAKAFLRRATCREKLGTIEHLNEAIRDYESAAKLCGDDNREIERSIRGAKLALKKAKRKDYYKLLGVSQTANDAELKKG